MRLIDADKLKQDIASVMPARTEIFLVIDSQPDALALLKEQEAVVRCKDCQRRGTYDCPVYVGGDGMCSEPDEWFCADGERRNDDA